MVSLLLIQFHYLFFLTHAWIEASKIFMKNIRGYNNALSFTSLGANIDDSVAGQMGIYTFRVRGQMHHLIGSLLPQPNDLPAFAQIFMYGGGGEEETELRIQQCGNGLDPEILQQFIDFMYEKNPYAQAFMMAEQIVRDEEPRTLRLTTVTVDPQSRHLDAQRYNLPTADEVAVVIEGDGTAGGKQRDIILRRVGGELQRISELHTAYLALRYPLLFPYGSQQWHESYQNPTARSRYSIHISFLARSTY